MKALTALFLLSSSFLFSSGASTAPIFFGSYVQTPIVHKNGVDAWSGIFPKGNFSRETAFFHENGTIAWGGLIQHRQTFTSDKAFFNYDNTQKAWGGLFQEKQLWVSENGKFYHPNGQVAWGGLDQNKLSWIQEAGKFYHSNGTLAWDGYFGSKVYYANGEIAWNGEERSYVYDESGKFVSTADYIHLHLGCDNWLYISSKRQFELILNLGPGVRLRVTDKRALFDVCQTSFDVAHDF